MGLTIGHLRSKLNHHQSAKNVSSAYDTITDLLSKVREFTGRLEEYTTGGIEVKLRQIVVDILTTLLDIFARSEKLIRRGRVGNYSLCLFA